MRRNNNKNRRRKNWLNIWKIMTDKNGMEKWTENNIENSLTKQISPRLVCVCVDSFFLRPSSNYDFISHINIRPNKKFVANNLYHVVQIIFFPSSNSVYCSFAIVAWKKPLHSFRIHLRKSREREKTISANFLSKWSKKKTHTISLNKNAILLTFIA